LLLSPFFLLFFLLVKFSSPGPIIYRNERLGEDGKIFDAWKFRTMRSDYSIGKQFARSEEALRFEEQLIRERGIKQGPVYKIANDPRVTPIGRWLRRASFDELPQLINVLRGQMSLVGPRPHQPREVEKYAAAARQVLNIKPGITGLAQISGRSDLSHEEEVRLDTYYIENWSPWLDLYILLKTPFVVISKKGAY
jgi:lipopolysaccharide/colanic/teichoic acid biosynthesis glycosyltransferase